MQEKSVAKLAFWLFFVLLLGYQLQNILECVDILKVIWLLSNYSKYVVLKNWLIIIDMLQMTRSLLTISYFTYPFEEKWRVRVQLK